MELIDSIRAKDILKQAPKALKPMKGLRNLYDFVSSQKNRNHVNYPLLVEHAAAKFPQRTLIKYQDTTISFQGFNQRANQIAHYLSEIGIKEGDVVALFMENRPEYLTYLTAISKAGAVAALINNAQTGKVLIHSLNLVSPKAIIAGEEVLAPLDEVFSELTVDKAPFMVPDREFTGDNGSLKHEYTNIEEETRSHPVTNLPQTQLISGEAPCLYIYTSGTTGLPKASIQKHRKISMVTIGLGMMLGRVKKTDTIYSSLPLYHATALFFSWLPAIANGASVAIRRKFSASEFWNDIVKYEATVFVYIGELCRYLLNQPPSALDKQHKIRMMSGNGLRPDLWDQFKERFAIKEIREFYGSSEGNVVCYNLFNQKQTMGMTLGSYAIVEIDTETEEPIRDANGFLVKAKPGQPGLLLGRITKATPFEGYTDPKKNESKILKNAFKKGDAWFNTGDMVKDLGFRHLQFVDRTGDTFRWKGENVSTGQVEMIVNQFPGVSEGITYGVEIPNTNGRAGMVAIKQDNPGEEIDLKGLYEYLVKELPKYAVPVFIRTLSSVDATGTFKYQRNTLKQEAFRAANFDCQEDKVFVALPGNDGYSDLDTATLKGIEENEYRF